MGRNVSVDVKNNETYFKEYYHKTKETIQCECGCIIINHQRLKHIKSKKHIQGINFFRKNMGIYPN